MKHRRRRQNRRKKQLMKNLLFTIISIILLSVIVTVAVHSGKRSKDDTKVKSAEPQVSTDVFDEGRLKLLGSMEYEGPNFESEGMENGTYTLLKIQNISGTFLRNADIEVQVNDSDKMSLTIDSLPADATVMVIGQGYNMYSDKDIYKVTSCKSSYEESVIVGKEGLEIAYEAGKIRLTNKTAEGMACITYRYKGKVENMLLGGSTYEFTVDNLPAGETFETDSQSFLADSIQIVEIKE